MNKHIKKYEEFSQEERQEFVNNDKFYLKKNIIQNPNKLTGLEDLFKNYDYSKFQIKTDGFEIDIFSELIFDDYLKKVINENNRV